MKTKMYLVILILIIAQSEFIGEWNLEKLNEGLVTRWTKDVDTNNVLSEYPRPNLIRNDWQSLNGFWNYEIVNNEKLPENYDGKILVPFPIESALSGVKQIINEKQSIWYKKEFTLPEKWNNRKIILHFEAVDWKTKVWVNGNLLGEHKGGYDTFSFDITEYLTENKTQELIVSVWDPSDKGSQPCGKQVQKPEGIFYTPASGIWQSVWLEPVSEIYLNDYKIFTDIDNNKIDIQLNVTNENNSTNVKINVKENEKVIGQYAGTLENIISINLENPKLWYPENPFLYDLEIELIENSKSIDKVTGYFGMRKISLARDKNKDLRIFLNNEFVFQNGPLDQGYWPDGIYTAPTDEALKYDIEITKKLGFNMLRKHVKVESRRFYYWCDKLGILVWQDMPTGGEKIGEIDPDIVRDLESATQFEYELERMIKTHFNNPSIIMWVPFNEGWGQYDTERIVDFVKELDPTRLVNNASGWADRGVGDIYDIHHYPNPTIPTPQKDRAIVIGEFGGIGLKIAEHTWSQKNWGYSSYSSSEDLIRMYEEYYDEIWKMVDTTALSAVVYTQITDVETEANGLLTYDREVIKIDPNVCKSINTNNYFPAPEILPHEEIFCNGEKASIIHDDPSTIRYTLNGNEPTLNDYKYSKEIILTSDVTIKAKSFSNNVKSRTVTEVFKKSELKRPKYKYKYNDRYTAGGDFALIDGTIGTNNYSDGFWQGFEGDDLNITFELQKLEKIKKININFLEDTFNRIFFPSSVELLISEDGEKFKSIDIVYNDRPNQNRESRIKEISIDVNKKVLFLKVIAKNGGVCPEWNLAKGKESWIFVDDITTVK